MFSFKDIEKAFLDLKGISIYKTQKEATKKILKYGGIEVNTGEGKSIISVATALSLIFQEKSKKIYIVTVNDYLAKRDYEEMKPIFNKFNISVGFNKKENIKEVLSSSVVYTSVNELIFLYLNSILNNTYNILLDTVIIDEADYTLIDCANTGCSISQGEDLSFLKKVPLFKMAFAISNTLKGSNYINSNKIELDEDVDFYIDKDNERIFLSNKGFDFIEKIFKKDLTNDLELHTVILNVLKAKFLYKNGIDYIVDNGKIIWIDKNNKRLMKNCKRELALQMALEMKEELKISSKGIEEISLSYQLFFYLFKNLYILSATLKEVESELNNLYGISIKKIKPRIKSKIKINKDLYFYTKEKQYEAVLEKINKTYPYPILLFEENDNKALELYDFLKSKNKKVDLLISSNYEKYEEILINKAGEEKSILITTPLCSRGVDIKLTESTKSIGLTSIILFNPINNRVLRQIIGRVGRNGSKGEVNKIINISNDLYLKNLSNLPFEKMLKEKEVIVKKQLSYEQTNRYNQFIIDKLLFEKYNLAIEISRNTDIKKLTLNSLNEYEIDLFNYIYENYEDILPKLYERIYIYNLNTTFSSFKELTKKISAENNINDISYKGLLNFEYRLNNEFNNYIDDLALISIKSLVNVKNIKYKKGEKIKDEK